MIPYRSIGRTVDVTSVDDLIALTAGFDLSRDALVAVAEALGPAADSVHFFAMF